MKSVMADETRYARKNRREDERRGRNVVVN